ncbi:hypothetical protein T484DRAFT_1786524, partial [Baffinella frigidus]
MAGRLLGAAYFALSCWITYVYFPFRPCDDLVQQEGVCDALHAASIVFVVWVSATVLAVFATAFSWVFFPRTLLAMREAREQRADLAMSEVLGDGRWEPLPAARGDSNHSLDAAMQVLLNHHGIRGTLGANFTLSRHAIIARIPTTREPPDDG